MPPLPPEAGGPPPPDGEGPPPLPQSEEGEEEDPLLVAQRLQEEQDQALEAAANIDPSDDPALRAFYQDMRDVDRENEINRVLGAFKLNPFEQLGLRFDAPVEDVRRAYRKVSLSVHPDKCSHPRAKEAFEIVGAAQKDLLDDDKRAHLVYLLNHAKDELLKEWRKAAKHDAAVRVAAALSEEGRDGVQAAYEASDDFRERWKLKARDVLAKSEWRRRKLTKRIGEESDRAKEEHKKAKQESKLKASTDKAWEQTRDGRVGSWRDFMANKSKKSKGGSVVLGGLKPPKAKESDEDKRYIQRPTGEQFRPPPPKR